MCVKAEPCMVAEWHAHDEYGKGLDLLFRACASGYETRGA